MADHFSQDTIMNLTSYYITHKIIEDEIEFVLILLCIYCETFIHKLIKNYGINEKVFYTFKFLLYAYIDFLIKKKLDL